jgi:hypothetical protein
MPLPWEQVLLRVHLTPWYGTRSFCASYAARQLRLSAQHVILSPSGAVCSEQAAVQATALYTLRPTPPAVLQMEPADDQGQQMAPSQHNPW